MIHDEKKNTAHPNVTEIINLIKPLSNINFTAINERTINRMLPIKEAQYLKSYCLFTYLDAL